MNFKKEVERLRSRQEEFFAENVLHILNGQAMYDEFHSDKRMGDSDYVPFNEAMCVHPTSRWVLDDEFIRMRAEGHRKSVGNYKKMVAEPLRILSQNNYKTIVLWFGEDVFCQMNLLTVLAYLEQSGYKGKVFSNSFRDGEFKIDQTELLLGSYQKVYEEVLLHHQKPSGGVMPVLHQAIELHLSMSTEGNRVETYIKNHAHLTEVELVKQLMPQFPALGYGDTQYREIIEQVRNKK